MDIIEKAQELLDSDISAYQISKDTGLSQGILSRLKNKEVNINKSTVSTVNTLAKYYDAMILNAGLKTLGIPINGDSDTVNELRTFGKRFLAFGQEIYDNLVEDDNEFATAFGVMLEDTMNDSISLSRVMLAWAKDVEK